MSNNTIHIAGSSCGGSSYAQRIISQLVELDSVTKPVYIQIGMGSAQKAVEKRIRKDIHTLEQLLTLQASRYVVLNINISLEVYNPE